MKGGFRAAYGGMMTALAVVFLLLASVVPSGWLGVTALAGLFVGAAVATIGRAGGALVWLASGILGLLLAPRKEAAVCYVILLGLYPVLKSLCEGAKHRAVEWALKLLCFNALAAGALVGFRELLLPSLQTGSLPLLLAGGNAVFVGYDCVFSQLMAGYCQKLLPRMKK